MGKKRLFCMHNIFEFYSGTKNEVKIWAFEVELQNDEIY